MGMKGQVLGDRYDKIEVTIQKSMCTKEKTKQKRREKRDKKEETKKETKKKRKESRNEKRETKKETKEMEWFGCCDEVGCDKEERMKKLAVLLCVGAMMFGLSACGSGNEEQGKSAGVENGGGAEGADVMSGSEKADGNGAAAAGAGTDGSGTAGSAEGGKSAAGSEALAGTEGDSNEILTLKSVILDTIGDQNYYPDVTVEADQLEEIFGITPEMYDEYLAEVSQDGTNVDTLLIIKAKDDKVEAVQEAMFAYRDAKEKATLEDPRNIGKVQASRIETNGNYVSFVQLGGDVTAALTSGEDAVIEQCLQMNELVLEVIAQNVY